MSNQSRPQAYTLGDVTVSPATGEVPEEYEYSDLKRHSRHLPTLVFSVVYWPVYLCFVFPVQNLTRLGIWSYRREQYGMADRLRLFIGDVTTAVRKLKFFTNRDRAIVFLRASYVITPTQLVPVLPGTTPIPEDPQVQRQPTSASWKAIRKDVYHRDHFRCVNCNVAGGSHGNAELHADHVIPKSRGGSSQKKNLRTLCRSCHEARHGRLFDS